MTRFETRSRVAAALGVALLPAAAMILGAPACAVAGPTAVAGYTLTTFASAPAGSSAPDSIAVVGNDVFVGYGNNGNPDGSGGAVSTIAEYSSSGALLNTTSVVGHNDGLRYDPADGKLWALQNEDANPNLVLITPTTLAKSAPFSFSATPHGGGYDDVAFGFGKAFISASNPANNPNTAPAIISATLNGSTVAVTGVLNANATATVINTGATTTLNLQDPDSMNFTPDGRLAPDSQADSQLVFVSNPAQPSQSVSVLDLTNQIDDTVFAGGGQRTLLFAAKGDDAVYQLTGVFGPGTAYSAAASNSAVPNTDFIGALDLAGGELSPIVSGLSGPGGEAFLPAPEPASAALRGSALLLLAGVARPIRRRR
ncbi:MAG TPA: hypothetical protein VGP52_04355 [Stellaceae bacterium]|nr:hypothetical protein [Stellaceae bacterium]